MRRHPCGRCGRAVRERLRRVNGELPAVPLPTNDIAKSTPKAKTSESSPTATEIFASDLPSSYMATWRFFLLNRLAMVNSPSTSATDRNDAESTDERRLGSTMRRITVNHDAPSERAASDSVRTSMARSPASSER